MGLRPRLKIYPGFLLFWYSQAKENQMPAPSRRQFLAGTALKVGAAGCLAGLRRELMADPLGMPIGCQTYPVRKQIEKDFIGAIKELAETGYRRIELCSPAGYSDSGFGGLVKYKGSELRKCWATPA